MLISKSNISVFCERSLTGPYTRPNGLKTIPFARPNGLKTIPSPAAHTSIANIWEYPLPPEHNSPSLHVYLYWPTRDLLEIKIVAANIF